MTTVVRHYVADEDIDIEQHSDRTIHALLPMCYSTGECCRFFQHVDLAGRVFCPPKRCSDARSVVAFSRRTRHSRCHHFAAEPDDSVLVVLCVQLEQEIADTLGKPNEYVIALETAFDTDLFSIDATIFNFAAVSPSTFAETVEDVANSYRNAPFLYTFKDSGLRWEFAELTHPRMSRPHA